jgi:hypothetical protein
LREYNDIEKILIKEKERVIEQCFTEIRWRYKDAAAGYADRHNKKS